jgi:hypothetical protein
MKNSRRGRESSLAVRCPERPLVWASLVWYLPRAAASHRYNPLAEAKEARIATLMGGRFGSVRKRGNGETMAGAIPPNARRSRAQGRGCRYRSCLATSGNNLNDQGRAQARTRDGLLRRVTAGVRTPIKKGDPNSSDLYRRVIDGLDSFLRASISTPAASRGDRVSKAEFGL